MSPAPFLSLAVIVATAAVSAGPLIPIWKENPLPENFGTLDGRNHYLQSETSMFLEMHANGTRGVEKRTEYGILTILLVRVNNISVDNWWNGSDTKKNGRDSGEAQHMIKGIVTDMYLCMDDHSVIYQSKIPDKKHCAFTNEYSRTDYRETYHRKVNNTKWYIGINSDGSIRCGNITRKTQKSARFNKIAATDHDDDNTSPPFVKQRKPCCPRKSCGRRRRKKCRSHTKDPEINDKPTEAEIAEEELGQQKTCSRTYINWCRKHRRQFFKLKLRDLKRYYNRCIKKNRNKGCSKQRHKVKHCNDR